MLFVSHDLDSTTLRQRTLKKSTSLYDVDLTTLRQRTLNKRIYKLKAAAHLRNALRRHVSERQEMPQSHQETRSSHSYIQRGLLLQTLLTLGQAQTLRKELGFCGTVYQVHDSKKWVKYCPIQQASNTHSGPHWHIFDKTIVQLFTWWISFGMWLDFEDIFLRRVKGVSKYWLIDCFIEWLHP